METNRNICLMSKVIWGSRSLTESRLLFDVNNQNTPYPQLGNGRVYLSLCKVSETPCQYQGGDILHIINSTHFCRTTTKCRNYMMGNNENEVKRFFFQFEIILTVLVSSF